MQHVQSFIGMSIPTTTNQMEDWIRYKNRFDTGDIKITHMSTTSHGKWFVITIIYEEVQK